MRLRTSYNCRFLLKLAKLQQQSLVHTGLGPGVGQVHTANSKSHSLSPTLHLLLPHLCHPPGPSGHLHPRAIPYIWGLELNCWNHMDSFSSYSYASHHFTSPAYTDGRGTGKRNGPCSLTPESATAQPWGTPSMRPRPETPHTRRPLHLAES